MKFRIYHKKNIKHDNSLIYLKNYIKTEHQYFKYKKSDNL